MKISSLHREVIRGGANDLVFVRDGIIVPRRDHRRELRELLDVVWPLNASALAPARLNRVDQSRARDVADGEPGARHRRAPTFQIQSIVGISEPELHAICVVAIALLRRSLRHPQFASAHGIVARHHRSLGADRIDLAPNFEGHDRDLPSDEHGDDDGRPEPALERGPDQDLVAELLLYRQIGVRAIASEHPVEKDLIPVEDLDVHIGGRGIEHDRPSARLKGRVRQRPACMGVPLSTWASRRRSHREEQDRLNAVQGIVREQRTVVPRVGSEHLISLRQHVDRAGGIGHDLLSQPVLEGRDHPVIAIVDDQEGVPRLVLLLDHHLPNELRPLNPERVVGRRAAIAAAPAIFPGGPPITCSSGSCRIGWSLSLTWNIVAPVPRILRGSIPSREPESRDLPAPEQVGTPCHRNDLS